jgi:hypothetical protein
VVASPSNYFHTFVLLGSALLWKRVQCGVALSPSAIHSDGCTWDATFTGPTSQNNNIYFVLWSGTRQRGVR